jgi:hypothetical protein
MDKIFNLLKRVIQFVEISEIEKQIIIDSTVTLSGYKSLT